MKIGKIKETFENTVGALGNENVKKVVDGAVNAIGSEKVKNVVGNTVGTIGKVTPVVGKVANIGMAARKIAILIAIAIGVIIALILSFKLGQWSGKRSVTKAEVADVVGLYCDDEMIMTSNNIKIV